MKCHYGIDLPHGIVPCGQCMICRINKRRQWAARILLEQAYWPHRSWFVTLTYADEHLPLTAEGVATLSKRELQLWLKRSQKRFGAFRYFAVGEYGTRTGRPHYHLALFPKSDSQAAQVVQSWEPTGFTSLSELSPSRAAYTANYTTKKLVKADDERLAPGQEPEFMCSSRVPGIGAACLPAMVHRYRYGSGKKHLETHDDVGRTVRIEGKLYPLGPYLLSKIRMELGIPTRHSERLLSERYREYDAKLYQEIGDPAVIDHAQGEKIIQKLKSRLSANQNRGQKI